MLSNEILTANGIVYRLCILKHNTVDLIINEIYAFEIHPFFLAHLVLPVVLYGSDIWSLTLREEQSLNMFETEVLMKIFGVKRD